MKTSARRRRRLPGALLLLAAAACARTGLDPGELEGLDAEEPSAGNGGAGPLAGSMGVAGERVPPLTGGSGNRPRCDPQPESCNGRDDDCNGAVDDLAAQPCPGGGSRFCVAGRWSDCPRRCEVCVPGSVRICQNSFCSFWGEQECAADGQGFGNCREAEPPAECSAVAKKFQDSPELERCCIDNGYCCVDQFDLDRDGDRRELLGACQDVSCP